MPKLTDVSSRTESDPENNKFLNKTDPKIKIAFLNIYGKLQWMKSRSYFDILNGVCSQNSNIIKNSAMSGNRAITCRWHNGTVF